MGLIKRETEADRKPQWSNLRSHLSLEGEHYGYVSEHSFFSFLHLTLLDSGLPYGCSVALIGYLLLVIQKAKRPGWDDSRCFYAHPSNRSRFQETIISSPTITGLWLTCSKTDLCSVSWRKKATSYNAAGPSKVLVPY